jgi:amino acid adenylation domain-containing protein/non-ribosomal peptide synthase protein (TIGR01720 family)
VITRFFYAKRSGIPKTIQSIGNKGFERAFEWLDPQEVLNSAKLNVVMNLPDYMQPSGIMLVSNFPLTSNGKIDRKALLNLRKNEESNQDYIAPKTEYEIAVSSIWQAVLGIEKIGLNDNFFELGGHSLLAMRVISAIKAQLKIELSVKDLFTYSTLEHLSKFLEGKDKGNNWHQIVKIDPRPKVIPLSHSQERLWFIDKLEGSSQYKIPIVFEIIGDLNIQALQYAFKELVNRHEVLRTTFVEINEKAVQLVGPQNTSELNLIDGAIYQSDEEGLNELKLRLIARPFDLSKDQMLRADLIAITPNRNSLLVTMHHIASDAWSLPVMVKEVSELYDSFVANRKPILPDLKLQYIDYVLWQKSEHVQQLQEQKLAYWKLKLEGISFLNLPTDFSRPIIRTGRGTALDFKLSKALLNKIYSLSSQKGTSLYMSLLAAFNVLLSRYSGQEDISVGASMANRPQAELENLIGFFVNTLTFRNQVIDTSSFEDLLAQVKNTTLEAYDNQDVPFEKIVDAVAKDRDPGRTPVFQVMLVLLNTPEPQKLTFGNAQLIREKFRPEISKFDLTFHVLETSDGLNISVEYSTDLYKRSTIERMMSHYESILTWVVEHPSTVIGEIPMLLPSESNLLSKSLNISEVSYPKQHTFLDLLAKHVAETPQADALVFEGQVLSYKQLDEQSNQVAQAILSYGVKPGSFIPLYTERGSSMLVGLIGILKSGCAYVPVDTDFPIERVQFILKDTNSELVVCDNQTRSTLIKLNRSEVVNLDHCSDYSLSAINKAVNANDTAYVIYTSGSTGEPKGVLISHQNLMDYAYGLDAKLNLSSCKTYALVSSIATDLGNTVIYGSLLTGGALHVFRKETVSHSYKMLAYFKQHAIDCLKIVPSHWKALSSEEMLLPRTLLIFGGEALEGRVVSDIQEVSGIRVVNHYGPTETTIGKLLCEVKPGIQYSRTVPIGKPFGNTQVYVLSKSKQLCPIGVPGELYIGGEGLAKGYLNRAELTEERFIDNPFSEGKLYATGDLVKYHESGDIEYLGRIDDQVKIRGYRIELGEVENQIQQSGKVEQSVVVMRSDSHGNAKLIAYVKPIEGYQREALIEQLKTQMPEYMLPSRIVELESFPMLANGKIDRKGLPDPESEQNSDEFVAARNEAEKALVQIWQDLLEVESVGIHDNFFELGGDSIITIQLVSRARRAGFELQVGDVFTYQTIARLSSILDQRANAPQHTGEQNILTGESGMLPIQHWFFEKTHKNSSHFNQSLLLNLHKGVGESIIKRAGEQLYSQHDALRFKYYCNDAGVWHQVYGPEEFEATFVEDLRNEKLQNLSTKIIEISDKHQRSLDIEKGLIFKLVLILTPDNEAQNRLLIVAHHLAVDGVSWRIILTDLDLLITGIREGGSTELGNKTNSYRQWYQALTEFSLSNRVKNQLSYWNRVVDAVEPLKTDYNYDGKRYSNDNRVLSIKLPEDETKQLLQQVSTAYNTEINDILLSALTATLCKWNGNQNIVIGMEGHGRETIAVDIDTSRTVGWFTTHYPILLNFEEKSYPDNLIKSVKENLRQIPDKGLGYGVLKYLTKEESLQGEEPWDVIFNYLGQTGNVVNDSKWLSSSYESLGNQRDEYYELSEKLAITAIVQSGELVFRWNYNSKCFEEFSIQKLANDYIKNLELIIRHCLETASKGNVPTPSDFNLSGLIPYSEFDNFFHKIESDGILKQSIQSIYRLTGLQHGMLFHGLYEDGSGSYMRQFECDIKDLNIEAFTKSWNLIVKQHSILRSAFYYEELSIPLQVVFNEINLPIEILDYSDLGGNDLSKALSEFRIKDHHKGFRFDKSPLIRITLIKTQENHHMVWTWHHILFDGWSIPVMMDEFLNSYESFYNSQQPIVKEVDNFEEYIQYLNSKDENLEEIFWKKYLKDLQQSTLLPFVKVGVERTKGGSDYGSILLELDSSFSERVQNFAQNQRLTVNTIMQGVWSFLLHQYTGITDIAFGVIVSGRPDDLPGIEHRVGMYINTLPLVSKLKPEISFTSWLQEIQKDQVEAREFQHTAIDKIRQWSGISGDLFDSVLVFENYPVNKLLAEKEWSLKVDNVDIHDSTNYPLAILISNSNTININFSFNAAILSQEIVTNISKHFEQVLSQVVNFEKLTLDKVSIITEAEQVLLVKTFNNTQNPYPKDSTIIDLFEYQAQIAPNATALVFEEQNLTYRELNEKANQLAHYLIEKGVRPEMLVPVCLERGIDMVIAILGILKSGGGYVPIDPEYPIDRISFMLEDCQAEHIIIKSNQKNLIKDSKNTKQIILDSDENLIRNCKISNPSISLNTRGLSYIIYTSGSTGKPKGVMIEHESVFAFIKWCKTEFNPAKFDLVYASTSMCFDLSVFEMFYPLSIGKSVRILNNGLEIGKYLLKDKSVLINSVPSVIETLLKQNVDFSNATIVNMAGEPISSYVQQNLDCISREVRNLYGPSEDTTYSTCYKLEPNKPLLIGKPIANTEVYILSITKALLPLGIPGEIYLSGSGLARGYLHNEILTSEKFIQNPFDKTKRLYKTGDIGRFLSDGNVEYLGRVDDQVKIRGYRIELGEIETAFHKIATIFQSAIIARADQSGNKRLIAYVVVAENFNKHDCIEELKLLLPEFMIPQIWVELKALPLTQNGKLDKKALPDPDIEGIIKKSYSAPHTQTQRDLAVIWEELLAISPIGIHDSFFEIGGHSLIAMRLISAIKSKLKFEIGVKDIFQNPTIEALAALLNKHNFSNELPPITRIEIRPDYVPLSYSQERMWFIDQSEGSLQYHNPAIFRLNGNLNLKNLEKAIGEIINRHETLRTVFVELDGKVSQKLNSKDLFRLEIIHDKPKDNESLLNLKQSLVRKPFILSKDLLFRATLIKLSDLKYDLVVVMHHIATDAWSIPILIKEVLELYNAYYENRDIQLPELKLQYADYALWQRTYLDEIILAKKLDYWKTKLDGISTLELPTDFTRPAIRGINGTSLKLKFDKKLVDSIHSFSSKYEVSFYMSLLAAFNVLLSRYSGQEDISVGASMANRPQAELENLIGFFVNTLTFRNQVIDTSSFEDLLAQVKNTTLEAYDNQDVPFEKVVEAVVKGRDRSRSPLFQVMLILINTPQNDKLQLGDVEFSQEIFDNQISKFDISLHLTETSDGLNISVEYSTDLYKRSTIERMMSHYESILTWVVEHPTALIGEIPMLLPSEVISLSKSLNVSEVSYPKQKTFLDLLAKHVAETPQADALVFEGQVLSYKQLDEQSNQVAQAIISYGVKPGSLIPLYTERGSSMLVGLIGILKSGCAYVPVDTDFPIERVQFILKDTNSELVVCDNQTRSTLIKLNRSEVVNLDHCSDYSLSAINKAVNANDAAYVIYTSGSTGEPKGVLISHQNLMDYAYGLDAKLNLSSCKTYALVSSIATDLGNTVIYGSLLTGGALHVFRKETVSDSYKMLAYFKQHAIDCLKIVPSHWKALSSEEMLLPKRLLIFGGEALEGRIVSDIQEVSGIRVVNHYGPTETTIGKLLCEVKPGIQYSRTVPIGKPFGNTQVYVLSKSKQLCPIGVPGELYIGGEGLAKGYLNRAELTEERFIDNPFSEGKLYATGDLVKYHESGDIEYLGRIDDQVKIRGYRIELGEVENQIQQSGKVEQSVVVMRSDSHGNAKLIAYVKPIEGYQREALIEQLKTQMPEYMLPSRIVELESFPMLANGKIDRKGLPDPESEQNSDEFVAARNDNEQLMAKLWQEILEVDTIGMNDDFFELGGHSLLAIRLVSAIRKTFKVEMPIGDIFDFPTVAQLVDRITKTSETVVLPAIVKYLHRPANIPLSFSQERLWFIDKLEGSVQYHIPLVLRLTGKINERLLEQALQGIIERHEVLRTIIHEVEGKGYQKIINSSDWQLLRTEISALDINNLENFLKGHIDKPFDLSKDYMLRAELMRKTETDHILLVTLHHIASDGWSSSIMITEFMDLYQSFELGKSTSLKPLVIQYADYAIWQREYLKGIILETKLNYWKKKLQDLTPLEMPTDKIRPAIQSIKGASKGFKISKEISDKLSLINKEAGTTMFMTMLSALNALLYRYSSQEDICVGTPVAGRQQQEVENLIGYFINTLALRNEVKGNYTFRELLENVKTNTLEAYQNQDVPFEKVIEAVVKQRDLSRSAIFQVLFVFQNTPEIPVLRIGDVEFSKVQPNQNTVKFELTFSLAETEDGMRGAIQYCTDLYEASTIERLIEHYLELVNSFANNPNQRIAELQILNQSEQNKILQEFNATFTDYPKEKTFIHVFEENVILKPNAVAVVFENQSLTYTELNTRANLLANELIEKGSKVETLIPICVERSLETIIGIVGILKASCAYVPIDPDFPQQRIDYILEDTSARCVVTTSNLSKKFSNKPIEVICLDESKFADNAKSSQNPSLKPMPENLMYVLYTSGSTGKPKGVMIEHYSLMDHCFGLIQNAQLEDCKSLALFSPIVFDAGHAVIFSALILGAELHVLSKSILTQGEQVASYITNRKVDFIKIVPSLWMSYAESGHMILPAKSILFGGEFFPTLAINKLNYSNFRGKVFNHYGPTEATIGKSIHKIDLNHTYEVVPIGKPFSNTRFYVLDSNLKLVPIGVSGELFISGDGIARGYLNLPELTLERFVPDLVQKKQKMYRTGDKVRWLADGSIEYIGRMDEQVKIRGYRIELGEIEATIQQSNLVSQAVVSATKNKQGYNQLVAYVVPNQDFEKSTIQSYLRERLPEYMIPSFWVELENIPLTSNGKIDRKNLPDPEFEISENIFVAPRNELEIILTEIWQDLLGIETVGIADNFFELGGHSLLAMRVFAAIKKQLGADLSVRELFLNPTIQDLAKVLAEHKMHSKLPEITFKPRPENIPLSFSQERLWFIDQLEGSVSYHIPAVLRLKGKLDFAALQNALTTLISRHEILRTLILSESGKPYQKVAELSEFKLEKINGLELNTKAEELTRFIHELVQKPFDLAKDLKLRATLIELSHDENLFVLTLHHIASDGWSVSILVKEIVETYQAYLEKRDPVLQLLPIQYADYAIWQRENLAGEYLKDTVTYWKNKLINLTPQDLPTDYNRPAKQSIKGSSLSTLLTIDTTKKLKELSLKGSSSLFMTILSGLKVLLQRYSGQEDICVGTSIAGRNQQEVENLIGFFLNTLALRTEVSENETFNQLLQKVKSTTLDAFENQDLPFEKVIENTVSTRDLSRSPLFQVLFVLQNTPETPKLVLDNVTISGENYPSGTTKFDLSVYAFESEQGLNISFEYCTELFKAETIKNMMEHFKVILSSVADNPDQIVGKIKMLTSADQLFLDSNTKEKGTEFLLDKSFINLFEEQVKKQPEAIALVFEDKQITYTQLNEKANQLAHHLIRKGVKPQTLVPLAVERSENMLIGLLGILKTGAAFIPIDPEYPDDRILYMLDNSQAELLVYSDKSGLNPVNYKGIHAISLSQDNKELWSETIINTEVKVDCKNLVYVIYTSGSTGLPKGVMIENQSLLNLLLSMTQKLDFTNQSRFLSVTTFSFDIAYLELFLPLLQGGELVLVSRDVAIDGHKLAKAISINLPTHMQATPSSWSLLMDVDWVNTEKVKLLIGGEAVSESIKNQLANIAETYNLYGPTETTIWSTIKKLSVSEKVNIGRPIDNTGIMILNHNLEKVPLGVPGDIWISGKGLARGYLFNPELTAERFITNPFNSSERIYKTGDLGKWLLDGNIEYLRRTDDQVKIRGYRIELGEIETVIEQTGLVKSNVVKAFINNAGSQYLAAFVVADDNYSKDRVLQALREKLPVYMIPLVWVVMEQFPLTPNGKIDRKALIVVETDERDDSNYVAAETDVEQKLVAIWQKLLGLEKIGVHDNFFELGGHSLIGMRVMSAINEEFSLEIAVRDLFRYTTIYELGKLLEVKLKLDKEDLDEDASDFETMVI